jgi:glycine/D-amino acid oxidase-like deaminating enzyme
MAHPDFLVVGGGVVGLSVAWGLLNKGAKVTVIDAGPALPQASTANFGLVWLQSKGEKFPAYGVWTREAVDAWGAFADALQDASGIDTRYRRSGGLNYCLGDAEWQARSEKVSAMRAAHRTDPYQTRMLSRSELEQELPGVPLGPDVCGASWNPHDGAVDPLRLMQALRVALSRRGADLIRADVGKVERRGAGYVVQAVGASWQAARLVLAAGLGNAVLAPQLGLHGSVRADRGQILVTERVPWRLPLPANGLRQTPDGTVLIGATKEGAQMDLQVTDPIRASGMAVRALRIIPQLRHVRVVRSWAGLRTMSNDSAPVYATHPDMPGATAINCHSGITLASVHASVVAPWLLDGTHQDKVAPFTPRRFDVPTFA